MSNLDPYIGHAAGLATSLLWSGTAMFFTAAGRRIGATTVNAVRIGVAIVLLGITHRALTGVWVPDANGRQVLLLALSGVLGLTIGDLALFSSFVRIGPRLAELVMTTSPILAALFGWLALGERLGLVAWLGMLVTISGVVWVVLERGGGARHTPANGRAFGLLLAFVGAACQAGGLLLSKQGLGHGWLPREQHLDPQAATLIRMFFAGVFVLPTIGWLLARKRISATRPRVGSPAARRTGYLLTFCGGAVGPYLGVWLSLVATDRAPLGVAQTLCSLPPVFILPLVALIDKERVSLRAVLGAMVAVIGVALLLAPVVP